MTLDRNFISWGERKRERDVHQHVIIIIIIILNIKANYVKKEGQRERFDNEKDRVVQIATNLKNE
jgi:hypothetical protein